MANFTQLTSQNPKTITAATAETGVDISGMDQNNFDLTIFMMVLGLDTGDTARISIDVSTDGSTWNSIWVSGLCHEIFDRSDWGVG